MAHKQFYVTEAGTKYYRTRMLSAGDPVTLSAPEARLQLALGHVAGNPPRRPKAAAPAPSPTPAPAAAPSPTPADKPKKAPAKRKKAPAKK